MPPLNNEVRELQWPTQSIKQILPRTCQTFAGIQGSNSPEKGKIYSTQLEFPSSSPKNNPTIPEYSFQSIDTDISNNTNPFVSIPPILSSNLPLHNNINSLPVINNNNKNNRAPITNKPNSVYQYPTVKKSSSYIISLNCAKNLQTGNMQHAPLKHLLYVFKNLA
jgi:hypothetical protein